MDQQLQIGDVVQLPSGGPKMTVGGVKKATVLCIWFTADGEIRKEDLTPAVLVKVSPGP